ncbi:PIG-L family deacetylase [Actinosynnema sp. NPDC050436]|uniref:PIG-L family deacetylase n=1 Tax=Actinosynnema sp. NPDC050436 TaxID=3155659 RepID=UPI0033F17416
MGIGNFGRSAVFGVVAALVAATTPATALAAPSEQVMQVVAHEDDDLLFMNPDIDQSIRNHAPTVTVFLTAGQITGDGATDEQRARNRQRGIQDAYARMAGIPDLDPAGQEEWAGRVLTVAGRTVERYVLTGRPSVHLVFVNLHDGALAAVRDSGVTDHTVLPENGLVTRSFPYARADVVAVLAGLVGVYRPTVLRAQDPLPDRRYTGDHGDHVAAARFAGDAAHASGLPVLQVNYRDYNTADVPVNLDGPARDRKRAVFAHYQRYDHAFNPGGWPDRMYYRWDRGTSWAGRNADGRPQVFVVRAGSVHTHWQTPQGGWAGPQALAGAGGPVATAVAVGSEADGRLRVFARRLSDHHLVTTAQERPNGGWSTAWTDLGNPNAGLGNEDQVGVPAVAAHGDGRLAVFAKNGGGGVSTTAQTRPGGPWGGWVDLYGTDVQDGVAAVTTPQGRIEVFASTRERVLRWYQAQPGGGFALDTALPSRTPASPPSAAVSRDGRVVVAYRLAGTADTVVVRQVAPGGGWHPTPTVLGGHAGVGEPAVVSAPPGPDARIMLFHRNGGTGVSGTRQAGPDAGYRPWEDFGGVIVDHPAVTTTADGRVVLVAIGSDGALHHRTQTTRGGDSPFGPWTEVG